MTLTGALSMCSIAERFGVVGRAALVGIAKGYSFVVNQEPIFEKLLITDRKVLENYINGVYNYKNKF